MSPPLAPTWHQKKAISKTLELLNRDVRLGIPRCRAVCYRDGIMTLPFQQRFLALAKERSPLCVGIDPSAEALKG